MSRQEDIDRPAASGHRFGPDLACSECGIEWETHQRDPHPCETCEPAKSDPVTPVGSAAGAAVANTALSSSDRAAGAKDATAVRETRTGDAFARRPASSRSSAAAVPDPAPVRAKGDES